MDRIELASQLISKGVELLDESYGAHGALGKAMEAKYKSSTNNKEKESLKAGIERDKELRGKYADKLKGKMYGQDNYIDKAKMLDKDGGAPLELARNMRGSEVLNRNYGKNKALHDKINNRAKSQNEAVADLLTEAAYLLSLVDDE